LTEDWYENHMRQVHMDFHMPEFPSDAIKRFNAREFVDYLEHGCVNQVTLFAKCHFGNSYYNTKVGHKHTGLEQDFLMEASAECRKRKIRTLAYYSLFWDTHAWIENIQWRFIDADENTYGLTHPFKVMCVNSPYKDELVILQLDEVLRNYPVDGLFIDIPFAYVADNLCRCHYCRRKWKAAYGVDIIEPLSREMTSRLVQRTVIDYMTEIRLLAGSIRPGFQIALNDAGMANVSKRVKELVDIGTWESQPQPGDYLGHSIAARTLRNDIVKPQVMTVRFYQGWGDLTLKPEAQLTTEFAAMIANGAPAVSGDQANFDGTLQKPVYDTFAKSFGFVRSYEDVFAGAQSVPHALVLIPSTDDPEMPVNYLISEHREMPDEIRGAHKLLVESHIQVDLGYSCIIDDLSRFPVVVLADGSPVPQSMHQRIEDYVSGGGILVAAGGSMVDAGAFALERLFGIKYVEPLSMESSCHYKPCVDLMDGIDDIPLQFRGQAYKVVTNGAVELAALHFPEADLQESGKTFRGLPPAKAKRSPYSFATVNTYGSGKAVYVAGSIFGTYWQTNHHWLRRFMESVLRLVDPSMPFNVYASGRVEANLMQKGNDLLLNLISYSFGHQGGKTAIAAVEQVEPSYDVRCCVKGGSVERVIIEPGGKPVPFEMNGDLCLFTVPRVEYLAVVRIVRA